RLRLTDDDRCRLAARAYRVGRAARREIATIATPDTLLRWHRQLIARNGRTPGNPDGACPVFEIRQLVVRMVTENPTWGLQADPRRAPERWPLGGPFNHSADPEGGGPAAGPAAPDVVADVFESTLGRHRRRRFFHDGSLDVARPGHLL